MVQENQKKSSGCGCGCGTLIGTAVFLFIVSRLICVPLNYVSDDWESATEPPTSTIVTEPTVKRPNDGDETIKVPNEQEAIEPPEEAESLQFTETFKVTSQSDELLERHFTWNYLGEWNWDLQIPKALYDYYYETPRAQTTDYSVYVTHPLDDIYIKQLVKIIENSAVERGFDEYQIVEFTIAFVQSLPYTVDSVTSPFDEYPRYPIETLVDSSGDCEDTSILLASLLSEMGYGVVLIALPRHMAVGVKGGDNIYGTYWKYEDNKYYYIETTGFGRRIGELPEEYTGTSAKIYPLIPKPIIRHEWSLDNEGFYIELTVVVHNMGTATAYDMFVFSGFDAGYNKVWSSTQSDTFNLEPGMQVTAVLYLRPPPSEVRTRLLVRIGMGEHSIDSSYSDWFDY